MIGIRRKLSGTNLVNYWGLRIIPTAYFPTDTSLILIAFRAVAHFSYKYILLKQRLYSKLDVIYFLRNMIQEKYFFELNAFMHEN